MQYHFHAPIITFHDTSLSDLAQLTVPVALVVIPSEQKAAWLQSDAGHDLALADSLGRPLERQVGAQWQQLVFLPEQPVKGTKLYQSIRDAAALVANLPCSELALHLEGFTPAAATLLSELLLQALLSARIPLPSSKHGSEPRPVFTTIHCSPAVTLSLPALLGEVEGNGLARHLAAMPASELGASQYRQRVRELAAKEGWHCHEWDQRELALRGAGAFLAVARGAEDDGAAIVHLRYAPANAGSKVALVGKGICHDSGGYNLKINGGMYGMHLDMGGSAVALGTLLAISRAGLPIEVDCWLAIAENHIGPRAFRPSEVVTAANGKTIEVVDTDAEGRMVLADTLVLAAEQAPDLLIDYATLTGACKRALGSRYSGLFCNRPEWLAELVEIGQHSGERVWPFPLDEDYDDTLKSDWADLLQCAPGASCDHIDAARFLSHFVPATLPWLHIDLSGFRHKGGHGVVSSEITGFGVRLTLALLAQSRFIANRAV
ncbi:leucyl aminopeptidase/proline iminopeptidase [Aeromonas sp. RU39B]|uniref:M17 family metallopeptidase n=1 Tax=Aeromonas sp. RU39B TaxID=1907416 RepID=UPI000954A8E4|nr:leucyl aminopeptidase family protein [Aeromonas sp. RU39B]SIQ75553.1 leucyl aminopeptidase/proline iminopeptidase [Aeromonas sp. RU39B]